MPPFRGLNSRSNKRLFRRNFTYSIAHMFRLRLAIRDPEDAQARAVLQSWWHCSLKHA